MWNRQGHHGSAQDPECWPRPWLKHDPEYTNRLSRSRRNLQESWNWAGQTPRCRATMGPRRSATRRRPIVKNPDALTKYLSREVLDRHVAAMSLKRLVGRAVTAPRAQLQLEPAVRYLSRDLRRLGWSYQVFARACRALPILLQLSCCCSRSPLRTCVNDQLQHSFVQFDCRELRKLFFYEQKPHGHLREEEC